LKTHIRHYDVICSYIENYMTLWRRLNYAAYVNAGKCRWLRRRKVNLVLTQEFTTIKIQINNKTINIEFGSRRICWIFKPSTTRLPSIIAYWLLMNRNSQKDWEVWCYEEIFSCKKNYVYSIKIRTYPVKSLYYYFYYFIY
jgi:hypothetical protein